MPDFQAVVIHNRSVIFAGAANWLKIQSKHMRCGGVAGNGPGEIHSTPPLRPTMMRESPTLATCTRKFRTGARASLRSFGGRGYLMGRSEGSGNRGVPIGGYINNYVSVNCSKWPDDSQWRADGSDNNTPNNTRTKKIANKSGKDCWVVARGCTLEPEPSPPLGGGCQDSWGGGCCPRWSGILGAVRVGRRDEVAGGRRGASNRRADGMTSLGSPLPPRRQQERHTKEQPTQSKPQM